VQAVMDAEGKELTAQDLWHIFEREYGTHDIAAPKHQVVEQPGADGAQGVRLTADVVIGAEKLHIAGEGTGPIDAFTQALHKATGESVRVLDYHEHAIGAGANAKAVAYLELRVNEDCTVFGVGIDANIVSASLKAIVSGLVRARRMRKSEAADAMADAN